MLCTHNKIPLSNRVTIYNNGGCLVTKRGTRPAVGESVRAFLLDELFTRSLSVDDDDAAINLLSNSSHQNKRNSTENFLNSVQFRRHE